VNAPCVALTHGTGGTDGDAQPVAVTSRSATDVRAWKAVVFFLLTVFCRRSWYAPVAVVFLANFDSLPLIRIRTVAPLIPIPAEVTFPWSLMIRFFLLTMRPVSVTAPGPRPCPPGSARPYRSHTASTGRSSGQLQ